MELSRPLFYRVPTVLRKKKCCSFNQINDLLKKKIKEDSLALLKFGWQLLWKADPAAAASFNETPLIRLQHSSLEKVVHKERKEEPMANILTYWLPPCYNSTNSQDGFKKKIASRLLFFKLCGQVQTHTHNRKQYITNWAPPWPPPHLSWPWV